jgi:hypothetical protein
MLRVLTLIMIGAVAGTVGAWSAQSTPVRAQGDGDRITVPLSDPSRPATVAVRLLRGGIVLKASDGQEEVVVVSHGGREPSREPPAEAVGLRRLSSARSGLKIDEQNNLVSIEGGVLIRDDVEISVPVRTNLRLNSIAEGDIVVDGVDGDMEITTIGGSITLKDVAGSVVAHATAGKVLATLRQVAPQKPMFFTSLSGNVDVTLPAAVKANLKLRSGLGEVYTDFNVQMSQPSPSAPETSTRSTGRARIAVTRPLQGTINGGGSAFELRTFNGNIYLRKGL